MRGVVQYMPVGGLDDRVAAVQRGLRAQCRQGGVQFLDGHRGVVHDACQAVPHPHHGVVDESLVRFQHGLRLGQARPGGVPLDQAGFVVHAGADSHAHLADRAGDQLPLLMHVRHDAFGRVGGGGCAQVGGQVDQCPIVLVSHGGDDRRDAGGRRADHALVGEADEVLEAAAAAGHDDHVDLRIGVEPLDRGDDVRRALRSLHMRVDHLEPHRWPAQVDVRDHIALGTRLRGAYQPDACGEFRQRHLVLRVEQPFALESFAQLVDLGLEVAGADAADVVGHKAQARGLDPHVGLAVHHHAVALTEVAGLGHEAAEAHHRQRDLLEIVPQRDVPGGGAAHVDLHDLPLHPGLGPFGDGVVVLLAQHADRPGVLRGGVPRQAGQLIQRPRAGGRPHIRQLRCRRTVSIVNSHAHKVPPVNGQDDVRGSVNRRRAEPVRRVSNDGAG